MQTSEILARTERNLIENHQTTIKEASVAQLHDALSDALMAYIADDWYQSRHNHEKHRCAYYFSAEYLVGRSIYSNMFNLGILDEMKGLFKAKGVDLSCMEEIEDAALGNGGLGRLAACYLDSAATLDLPLNGYGLRYKYGLFKQTFTDGYQTELADDWQKQGDPWGMRRESHQVYVSFSDLIVRAVPYDMPVIGYGTRNINTLRLWQSEPIRDFDFQLFNDQDYERAVLEKNAVEDITRVLYPNDTTPAGKKLRLRQQYFLSSASLQDILIRYKREGHPVSEFCDHVAIQLNDTHPTVSIPELIRLLMEEGLSFEEAFEVTVKTFSYTNHTVMTEALEKWNVELFKSVLPEIFDIIFRINARLCAEIMSRGLDCEKYAIIHNDTIHMANLAVYGSSHVNGVAAIHTEILKTDVLKEWYALYPDRFCNKTNGITQRRWLGLCNPELCGYIDARVGQGYLTDLSRISGLREHLSDSDLNAFLQVKKAKKEQLCAYIRHAEGVDLPSDFIFDVQVKRMHEYKRQILNAFAIMDIYFRIRDHELEDFPPTVFLFGAKAAPGYIRAKAIIKYINSISELINSDPVVNDKMRVLFVRNYNCSYAEHIIPAADISEQISPAGTEASGTGNMKLMLNGAVTLGTYDGANIEIVQEAGRENNFIFGRSVEELAEIRSSYDPRKLYETEPRIRRIVDTLIDGTVTDGNTGAFADIYRALVNGNDWEKPDHYFVLLELLPYIDKKLEALYDTKDRMRYARKALMNIASSGKFSSDRSIREYAEEIWHIDPLSSPRR